MTTTEVGAPIIEVDACCGCVANNVVLDVEAVDDDEEDDDDEDDEFVDSIWPLFDELLADVFDVPLLLSTVGTALAVAALLFNTSVDIMIIIIMMISNARVIGIFGIY